jgi:molybdate transport system substrate-binding protein
VIRLRLASTVVVLPALAGCGGDAEGEASGDSGETLTVFAASSLTATFTELADDFEGEHEGVTVELSFAGSSDLVAQVQQGAPADVVATADTVTMERLTSEGLVGEPVTFATNRLEIVVPPGNPAGVASLQDLARPGLALVVCAPQVPCGAATSQVAEEAEVRLSPVSEEPSVTDVLGKVVSGEADAGLVYVTDVLAAGDDAEGIEFPESQAVVNSYPVAVVAGADSDDLAEEFVALVTSDRGRAVLSEAGFGRP